MSGLNRPTAKGARPRSDSRLEAAVDYGRASGRHGFIAGAGLLMDRLADALDMRGGDPVGLVLRKATVLDPAAGIEGIPTTW